MKKYILSFLSIAVLGFTACNEETKETAENTATEIQNTATDLSNTVQNVTSEVTNAAQSATEVISNPTTIKVDKMEHDFGKLTTDKPVSTTFTITNTGKNPLIITSAKGSCGCTVPQYPTAPIEPGKTGKIDVTFDPKGKSGPNNKTVTILANTEPAATVLNVKSDVNIVEQK